MRKMTADKKNLKENRSNISKIVNKQNKKHVKPIPIVGVGASAGGLAAFKDFFKQMPIDTGMAFVLIQHLDPNHESLMVDLLSRHTRMNVIQVEDNMTVEPNHVYMIPPNYDLAIEHGILRLTSPHQRRGMRMPIDFFFNSLAEDQREKAVCIILSGTGSDGTMGLKSIKSYGGVVMVQQPEEAQYDGMPASAISTGVVDYVLKAEEMADVLVSYIQHAYVKGHFGMEPVEISEPDDFNAILAIMYAQLGHNFHHYKKNTLIRRINRRMGLKQIDQMHDYAAFLRKNPEETEELFKDCLIGVTGFFRENDSWHLLSKVAIDLLLESKSSEQPIRIWVPGCSSGEEAYTLSILFNEKFSALKTRPHFSIFATDIDSNALEFARVGRYPESIASDLPEEILDIYFKKEDGFYQVSNKLRENIVFSAQNLISDPPFSKLDLITCRNLLIYLESRIQQKVIELFHFALNKGGFLMLGNSETIGQNDHLFESISKKWRIYKRLETSMPTRANFPILPDKKPWSRTMSGLVVESPKAVRKPGEVIRDALLAEFAPISVLITRSHDILYHFGDTSQYLQFPPGEHTSDLFALTRDGLTTRIRGAVHKAIKNGVSVSIKDARVKRNGKYHKVGFNVRPLNDIKGSDGLYLVSFYEDQQKKESLTETEPPIEDETIVRQLEHELSSTKEELQNTIEELETSNEELKASNEEIMSMNEELQSSNEELETSKEELQSLNEELNTVNNELQEKVRSLEETNNDITNLVNSTNIAAIFLDTRFNINFYTPPAKKLFNLIATDIGRPLKHITKRFEDPHLISDAENVLDTLRLSTEFVFTDENEWFNRKIYPYRTQDGRIEGIVLTFENVTELKQSLSKQEMSERRLHQAQKLTKMGYWDWYIEDNSLFWSEEVYNIFDLDPKGDQVTVESFENAIHPDDYRKFMQERDNALSGNRNIDIEHRIVLPDGNIRWVHEIAEMVLGSQGELIQIAGAIQDITDNKMMEMALRDSEEERLRAFLENSAVIAWLKDDEGRHVFLSRNYEKRFNVKQEDWVNKTDFEVWPEEIASEFRKNDLAVLESGKPIEVIERTVEPGGRVTWWLNNKFTYTNASGKRFVGGLGVDITCQDKEDALHKSEGILKGIFDYSPALIYMLDTEGRFLMVNRRAELLFGIKSEILIGKTRSEILPDEIAKSHLENDMEVIRLRKPIEFIEKNIEADVIHYYLTNKFPVFDQKGEITGVCGISFDITEQEKLKAGI